MTIGYGNHPNKVYLTKTDIALNDKDNPNHNRLYRLQCKLLFALTDLEAETIRAKINELELSAMTPDDPEQEEQDQWERKQEYESLNEIYQDDKAADLIGMIKKSGKDKSDLTTITPAQWKRLTKLALPARAAWTKDGKYIMWEYALDELASERGYAGDQELHDAILNAKRMKDKIRDLRRAL